MTEATWIGLPLGSGLSLRNLMRLITGGLQTIANQALAAKMVLQPQGLGRLYVAF